MRFVNASAAAVAAAVLIAATAAPSAQDADKKVAGGGVTVKGWQGKADPGNRQGLTVNDSKFAPEGNGFRLMTGPAGLYWNPANSAKLAVSPKGSGRSSIGKWLMPARPPRQQLVRPLKTSASGCRPSGRARVGSPRRLLCGRRCRLAPR